MCFFRKLQLSTGRANCSFVRTGNPTDQLSVCVLTSIKLEILLKNPGVRSHFLLTEKKRKNQCPNHFSIDWFKRLLKSGRGFSRDLNAPLMDVRVHLFGHWGSGTEEFTTNTHTPLLNLRLYTFPIFQCVTWIVSVVVMIVISVILSVELPFYLFRKKRNRQHWQKRERDGGGFQQWTQAEWDKVEDYPGGGVFQAEPPGACGPPWMKDPTQGFLVTRTPPPNISNNQKKEGVI